VALSPFSPIREYGHGTSREIHVEGQLGRFAERDRSEIGFHSRYRKDRRIISLDQLIDYRLEQASRDESREQTDAGLSFAPACCNLRPCSSN